jgi:hypothetical protein
VSAPLSSFVKALSYLSCSYVVTIGELIYTHNLTIHLSRPCLQLRLSACSYIDRHSNRPRMSTKSAGSSGSEDSYGSNKTAIRDPSYSDGRSVSGETSFTDMAGDSKASTCTLPESIPCLLRNGKEKDKDKDYPTFDIPFQKVKRLTLGCKRIPDMPKWLTDSDGEDDKVQRAFAYRWFRAQPQRRTRRARKRLGARTPRASVHFE